MTSNRWLKAITALAALGFVLSAGTLAWIATRTAPEPPDPMREALAALRIPEFTLVDQDGREVDESIFEGRVTVLDFFFTNCPFVCPGMAISMHRVQEESAGTGVQLVGISVDPEHDTPDVLRAYGESAGADPQRWRMLTGDAETIRRIASDGLKFLLAPDPSRTVNLPGGGTMDNISHPSRLILIGPDRRVLGLYSYQVDDEVRKLVEDAKRAAEDL